MNAKQTNNVKNRMLILSPTVQEGLERECNKDDFEALDDKALGKGGFGQVWKVKHKTTNKIYAIKVINKDYIRKENMIDQMNREIEIMYRTDHPHIIKLYNHFEDDENFYLIMHCASKGQLYSLLKRLKRLDERTVAQFLREIISAVKYLHSMNPPIIHRDIKPENVLLDNDGRALLADFGWSNFQEQDKKRETYCGTPEYLAPEMVTKSGHNEGVDIWSLGVLAFELLAGRPPFIYKGDTSALYNDIKNLRIKWTDDFPMLAKNLISKILRLKASERPSLDEILDHPWFKETPPTRKVLSAYEYDPASKLRSHLVNVIVEEKPVIKTRTSLRKDSLKATSNEGTANTNAAITNNVELYNTEITNLKEEITKKDKLIKELSSKVSSDETTLRLREQEKLSLLTELEHNTKKNLEIESAYNLINSEYSQLQKTYKQLRETQFELSERNRVLEQKNTELTNRLNELEQERQLEIMNYEKKLRIVELKIVEKDGKDGKDMDPDQILNLTKGYLSELVEMIRAKMTKIEERIINQEKTEADFRSVLIENIDRRLNELVVNLKENHEKVICEEKNFYKKQLYEAENKNANANKTTEWYKSQIAELYPFKAKYNAEKYELDKLKKDKETLQNIKNF